MKFAKNNSKRLIGAAVGLALTLIVSITSYAFSTLNSSWPLAETTFFVQWDAGGVFDTAFIEAIDEWNGKSLFQFNVDSSRFVDPCLSVADPDRENGYRFSADDCGREFGATTLAVAWIWQSGSTTVDADIIFNDNFNWGIHNNTTTVPFDFKRIAVHELGHALGLGHESTNPAILQPSYSLTIMVPQIDDINGAVALYGFPDTDNDSVPDNLDNCTLIANPGQLDSNMDGYGNICDGDFNQTGAVDIADFAIFAGAYGTTDADADLNGSGFVDIADFAIFAGLYGGIPGPSGLVP